MKEQREMLYNAIQQNTQLCVQNAELMEANREYCRESMGPEATKTKIFVMAHPERFCCRANNHVNSLDTLQSNFLSHECLFLHGDPDRVKNAASLISTWNNHPDPAQRQTPMTDLADWLRDVRRDSHPCLENFGSFSEEMQKMYGNEDRKLNAALKCTTDLLTRSNELVTVYANRINTNWRAAGWLLHDNKNHHHITWDVIRPGLRSKIKPLTPKNPRLTGWKRLLTPPPIEKSCRTVIIPTAAASTTANAVWRIILT